VATHSQFAVLEGKEMVRSTLVGRWLLLLVGAALLLPFSMSAVAQTEGDMEGAIDAAIALSVLESKGNAGILYLRMHPDAREIIPKSAVVGWYTTDFFPMHPHPISEIINVQFVDWTWPVTGKVYHDTAEITYIQPFGTVGRLTYQQETVRLVKSQGHWRWFFGRSADFVEAQVARFPEDSNADPSSSRTSSSSTQSKQTPIKTTQRSSTDCTLVELFPGYPGYRGVVTGMLANWGGVGDWACLEALEALNPSFDKNKVDAANIAAARELGISGQPEDWTWENWMQIEAVRGLPMQCYSCVLLSAEIIPMNTAVRPDPTDPRILLGYPGRIVSHTLVNADRQSVKYWQDDYQLRTTAYFWDGLRLNAPQLLDMYDQLNLYIRTPGSPSLDLSKCMDISIEQGGYTWVPDNASREDQVFIFGYAVFAVTHESRVPAIIGGPQRADLMSITEDWYRTGSPMLLRVYVGLHWPP
jgi:hypothetical protein